MHIGSLRVRLYLREARSLKDKRRVLQSIRDRLRNELNVAVAEVDAMDHRQIIVLGFAAVSSDASQVRSVLQHLVDALRCHPVAELMDYELEELS